jgi:hypothetical protein
VVRWFAYYETQHIIGIPDGAALMPLGWWGFFVILAMEAAMFGGVMGEIMNKRIYGWKKARHVRDLPEAGEGSESALSVPSNNESRQDTSSGV